MISSATGIWDLATVRKGGHKHDEKLVNALFQTYRPTLVADLGCGDGWYCQRLKELGWKEVYGFEGCEDMLREGVYNDIFLLDLSKRINFTIDFDFVYSLEVGEHIPKKYEEAFLDNIGHFAKVSNYLVVSWAIPGQGGRGHCNEQPNEYIIEQLKTRGFKLDPDKTSFLRENSSLKWFRNSLMAFEKIVRVDDGGY